MRKLTICTQNICSYCKQLKLFLTRLGYFYDEIDLTNRPEAFQALKEETGLFSLPQVFVGDDFLGGYDNIIELQQNGKLKQLLDREA